MSNYCFATLNGAEFILQDDCTPSICSVQVCGQIEYIPNLGGNAFYMAVLIILLLAQLFLCIRYKTWGFLVGMFGGLVLEILGYGGRVWLHNNIFNFNAFLLYLIPLTIGPAFLSGSIYICLGRIVNINGAHLSRFSAKTYAVVFVSSDIFSLVLQAVGGALASEADTKSQQDTGVNIMIAGLAYQVFSLLLFLVLWGDFVLRIRKAGEDQKSPQYAALRRSKYFLYFQFGTYIFVSIFPAEAIINAKLITALLISTLLILIRSTYRVIELQGGFGGSIANNEPSFMILEGPMIIIAVLLVTICHPGLVLKDAWQTASFSFRSNKGNVDQYQMSGGKDSPSNHSDLRGAM